MKRRLPGFDMPFCEAGRSTRGHKDFSCVFWLACGDLVRIFETERLCVSFDEGSHTLKGFARDRSPTE